MLDFPDCLKVCANCEKWTREHGKAFGRCSEWTDCNDIRGQNITLTREDADCEEFDPEPGALEEAEKWLEKGRYDDEALGLVRGVDYPFSL